MSERIKLKLGKVCDGRFLPALRMLLHTRGLLATDAFRLRKTWDMLAKEELEYRRTHERLLREYGATEVSNVDELKQELNKLNGLNELNGEQKKCKEKLETDLAAIVSAGKEVKQLVLDKTNPRYADFLKQLTALQDTDVETDLRQKVRLPEQCYPDGAQLSAAEIGELFDIIEEPR